MANIRILPQDFELTKGSETIISLGTKDTYVLEDIDVVVKPHTGSFNNQATDGVTYTENTADATIIPAEGFLYLNQGWFENTKISLGHLIPDDVEYTNAGVSQIVSGYEAYDTNGQKLIGTMATVDPKFDGGGLSVSSSVSNLTGPTVTVDSSGTFKSATNYGVTSTAPSGTDGTSYLTIDGKASVTTKGSVKASASATRDAVLYNGAYAGYLNKEDNTEVLATATTSKTSDAFEIGAIITDSFNPLYIPIVSVTGTGGGMTQGTSSVEITGTNPTLALTYGGKFTDTTVGASYGVRTTAPTGTDGTDFLKVDVSGSPVDQLFTATASIEVNRAPVTNSGLKQGAINIADGATLLTAGSNTFTQSNTRKISVTLSNEKAYYIPIIKSMPVSGGTLSQGTSSVTVDGTNPTVTLSYDGKFTDATVGASYGVTTTAPTTGTDGTNFLKITIGGTSDEQTFTGSASIKVDRAAVTHNGAAAGAIKWTDGSSILTALNNQEFRATNNSAKTVTASVTGGTSYYIPIVSLTDKGKGGRVTVDATANVDIVKPKVDYTPTGTVTTNLEALGVSHRPFEGEEDGSGYYSLVITPTTTLEGSVSGSVSGSWSRTAVKSNGTYQGAVNLTTDTQFLAADNGTITGTDTDIRSTDIGVDFTSVTDDDKNWYFKRAQVTAEVNSHTVTYPTVNYSESAEYYISGVKQNSVPSGILLAQTSNPSDFATEKYIKIEPTSGGLTLGNSKTTAKGSISAGITAGGSATTTESTQQIGVNQGTTKSCYIKVYDGGYIVS